MNPDNLIIEDFDFLQYPITRIYPLGGKTVVQIGESLYEKPKSVLQSEIDDLEHNLAVIEEEKENAEKELEKAEKELNDLEEQHNKELDKIENSLESAEQFLGIKTSERLIHRRITELSDKIEEKFDALKEEISRLRVDNTALAWNIEQQDQALAKLEENILAAQQKHLTNN